MSSDHSVEFPEMTGPEISGGAERALLEIRDLIETVVARGEWPAADSKSLLVTAESARAALEALQRQLSEARRRVDVLVPSDRSAARLRIHVLSKLASDVPEGVAIRVLDCWATADRYRLSELQKRRRGIGIRLTDAALSGAIIVDGETVLTRSDGLHGGGPRHTALMRAPAVVEALNALYADVWNRAVPLSDEHLLDGVMQEILDCLRRGYTDDTAARALSMSVRTYRRHVAGIMRILGASSRFQAGVHATEMGLLRGDLGGERSLAPPA